MTKSLRGQVFSWPVRHPWPKRNGRPEELWPALSARTPRPSQQPSGDRTQRSGGTLRRSAGSAGAGAGCTRRRSDRTPQRTRGTSGHAGRSCAPSAARRGRRCRRSRDSAGYTRPSSGPSRCSGRPSRSFRILAGKPNKPECKALKAFRGIELRSLGHLQKTSGPLLALSPTLESTKRDSI